MHLDKQPDSKASAKATIPLPLAQPPAAKALDSSATNPYEAAREALLRDGYVILPASLFPSIDLPALRTAATRLTHKARTGEWPYIRTLPKQFPPWPQDPADGIWGVQHLLHPSNPDASTFAKSYFDAELVRCVSTLVGCAEDELCMELYNMLVRPDRDFSLRWHRDDVPATATPDEEIARLAKPGRHAQWNLALADDESLVLVPGSHKRARTATERDADPYQEHLPGQITVKLQAGEVAFYDNNILHRGVYSCERERMTLHGSMGTGGQRARNVLQHGVGEWVGGCDFTALEEGCQGRAEGMRDRLVVLGSGSGDVGFFAEGE
ncbi:hypothetical protein P153DRAFT_303891 [Dothidotthia symphoricarpi CBS 119687]|uniref:Phytanoyl-CoA dioxygenase family protein n=1 Tax=Dothidotthia symphoricarpi CBS 119687 TaxID=1392245 RepID=A0A6A5ZW08_9PLEO|nr:uncharacterized protein P153DRAFT_303891 [Dothidotthia symphoricarpi CBS 119687]KAF2123476.1 hypothetical protein P153DRAFT_303891 [Dothidotthia symphoricarpi CBS 119687]